MVLVSRNIRYMRIFAGVPRGWASNDSGVVDVGSFSSVFGGYLFRNFRQDIQDIYTGYTASCRLFSDPRCITSTLNDPE